MAHPASWLAPSDRAHLVVHYFYCEPARTSDRPHINHRQPPVNDTVTMMGYTNDFLFLPPFVPFPPPDIPFPGQANRLSQSLLHLHVVGSTPKFTPVRIGGGGSPVISDLLSRFQHFKFNNNNNENNDENGNLEGRDQLTYILRGMRLTEEQLIMNSFPRWKNAERNEVVVEPSFFDSLIGRKEFIPDEDTKRKCVRCHAHYRLPGDGRKRVDFCIHHREPAVYSSDVKIHPCCGRAQGSVGCQHSDFHVTDTMRESVLREFHATPAPGGPLDPRSKAPEHELVDPNTRYSGLTSKELENTAQKLGDIRALLFGLINSETLLIGHALENDLKALRIVHDNVIDTSVLFSRSPNEGRCFKQSLKSLALQNLDMEIQTEACGHDSAEDAWAAMQLVLRAARFVQL
ncbi:unnamed protein product [Nippostrongylus brasiliensis]|uniref:Putative rnase h (inferred by orthology to a S. mansoni protein) n=1 Tax=Nippostrongylus brasiliensis TaxID=27835 RepID=A0A0N4XVL3_NIPBR|nr:unnamed protein product [Nippostrongylus brasiliensis]